MIKFGVAGNSNSFYAEGNTSTLSAAKWCADRNLDVFEYSFGRGVNISSMTAKEIGAEFAKYKVELTAHAPYYINFANPDGEQIEKSFMYITKSLEKLIFFGGNRLVVHPASVGKTTREVAVNTCLDNLKIFLNLYGEDIKNFKICFETMGKLGQIGTVEEIAAFANLSENFYPCIDFGHVNARTFGSLRNPKDFEDIIVYLMDNLPFEKVDNMHVHFSKIMYGNSGEIKHLTFSDTAYGPEFEHLSEILHKYKLNPVIICESDGTQAEDAVYMKKIYNR